MHVPGRNSSRAVASRAERLNSATSGLECHTFSDGLHREPERLRQGNLVGLLAATAHLLHLLVEVTRTFHPPSWIYGVFHFPRSGSLETQLTAPALLVTSSLTLISWNERHYFFWCAFGRKFAAYKTHLISCWDRARVTSREPARLGQLVYRAKAIAKEFTASADANPINWHHSHLLCSGKLVLTHFELVISYTG